MVWVRLLNFFQTVQTEDLPIDPFMGKIEEGLAKQIPLDTIAAVLGKKLEDYRFVRRVLTIKTEEQEISHQDLSRMVGSLDGGITREELARFIQEASAQDLSMLARATEILALLKQVRFQRVPDPGNPFHRATQQQSDSILGLPRQGCRHSQKAADIR